MNYISVKDAALKWCVSVRQVQHLCLLNKIPGAVCLGKQWLIPESADRPIDGRTKNAKADTSIDSYHFPILVHSRYYSTSMGLNNDEKKILKAQILNVQGSYNESIELSREAIVASNESHILFGGFVTLAYDYMLLGDFEKLKACIIKLDSLLEREITHKEDFLLAYNGLMLHIGRDRSPLMNINQFKLSSDAIIYFQSIIIESSFINNEKVNFTTLKLYETLSRDLVAHGLIPTLILSHCLLALLYQNSKNTEMCEYHTKEACDLATKHHLLNYISKYYYPLKEEIDNYFSDNNKETISYLERKNQENYKNWMESSEKILKMFD